MAPLPTVLAFYFLQYWRGDATMHLTAVAIKRELKSGTTALRKHLLNQEG
jgi:hypothetical protein